MIVKTRVRDRGIAAPYLLPDGAAAADGDALILENERGLTYGIAFGASYAQPENTPCCQRPRGEIIRVAGSDDLARIERLQEREREAHGFCWERAEALGLNMHITELEGFLSAPNLVCYFTAEQRVDFRQLVRDVGGRFRCHVLMRQVPPREHARAVSGVGPCGRTLCCSSFMSKPKGISSQDARRAAPGVSHSKLTGACGKLMCCLDFESRPIKSDLVQVS